MRLARTTAGAVRVVDAPVSGGVEGAEAGTLSIMVGGEEHDVADAWAVLSACGNPVHLGPLGSGQVAKACNQMIVASTILALGEAAVLAKRSGLDLAELFRLLGGGYAGSRILESRGDRIIQEDYSPSGVAKYMVKDLDFASAVAAATGTHPVLLPAVKAAFEELTALGHGDSDIAVTRRYIEQRRGRPRRPAKAVLTGGSSPALPSPSARAAGSGGSGSRRGGGAVSFGSDAHVPLRVGALFDVAVDIVAAAGLRPGSDEYDFWRR